MKEFKNPEIKIFEFSKEEIILASGDYNGGGSAGNEGGGDILSVNPEVNINTITK